ncbi:MAG: DNA-directed RNA polymerase subunit omega [Hungatella sp.]|nr:DNA-directed RNA polymerase subunit omega [Hungatella sp.]
MLHPSYTDLINAVNSEVEPGEEPVVQSRYSIVIATAKRARQLIAGEDALVRSSGKKPLSVAVEELYESKIKILSEDNSDEELSEEEGQEVTAGEAFLEEELPSEE